VDAEKEMVDTLVRNSNLRGYSLRGGDSRYGTGACLPVDRA